MEIETLEDFRKIRVVNPDNFLVITDLATGDIIHIVMCDFVKVRDFEIKVLENKNMMGKYYYFETFGEAKKEIPSISICKKCQKYFVGRK